MSKLNQIKKVALELFAEKGFDATSMSTIANAVGIKKASVYSHIKSKEGLYLLLLDEVLEWDRKHFKHLMESNEQLNAKEKFHLLFIEYCRLYQVEPYLTRMKFINRVMIFPPEIINSKHRNIFEEKEIQFFPILITLIHEGQESGEIKLISEVEIISFFYCLIDGLFVESCYYKKKQFDNRSEKIWLMFWKAINDQT
ncbi:TetR/AcrR family transcriptional regulator [Helicovermis profundi]|uniref:TetR/AcrR family transcriptional regulator n=1 Tax=Helicovermis profundi TaxID=3065157 RepID=A0AAU9EP48_9FIRM|nr:TetR/AcrR family transcriptional regulator [Clostridia bacterium S502]